jgi:hypothetical protein
MTVDSCEGCERTYYPTQTYSFIRLISPFFLIAVLFFLSLSPSSVCAADIAEEFLKGVFVEGLNVDLKEPFYCDGALTTEKGGVITGSGIRIQARKIVYTRRIEAGKPSVVTIEAEDDLMVEFGRYVFIGRRLEYDFQQRTGVLFDGCTSMEPWFIGGERISLCADGSYHMQNAFLTTSENYASEWQLVAEETQVKGHRVQASNVRFQFAKTSLLWLPTFNIDLDALSHSPFRYTVGWGGKQGPRASIAYNIFSWQRLKAFVRFDYRLNRGPGAGIETSYLSEDHKQSFETISFAARDSSLFISHERFRYRFQGHYQGYFDNDKTSINLIYDKLSDKDMATDYDDHGLDLENPGRTQLNIRRQEPNWIGNLMIRVRVNPFETVKEELPTIKTTWRPIQIASTGIISENQLQIAYLDFVYGRNQPHVHNYHSPRVELSNKIYRPFTWGPMTITPEVGRKVIFYGDAPGGGSRLLLLGLLECNANMRFYRFYDDKKHEIIPYARYQYYTYPTVSPKRHYIFDINDGWFRYNRLRFGTMQSLCFKDRNGNLSRSLSADFYANAFFSTRTIPSVIPKVYADFVYRSNEFLKHTVSTAWDFSQRQLDHLNYRAQWTVNEDFAISAEYRYRDAFDWRKADRDNFILDSYRPVHELKHSSLSDRRDTALLHFFYRLSPKWALEFESRHGWGRKKMHRHNHSQRPYNEMEVDLHASLGPACQVKIAYQHNTAEDRIAVYFSVGILRPNFKQPTIVPYLEF